MTAEDLDTSTEEPEDQVGEPVEVEDEDWVEDPDPIPTALERETDTAPED